MIIAQSYIEQFESNDISNMLFKHIINARISSPAHSQELTNIINRIRQWREKFYELAPKQAHTRAKQYRNWRNFIKASLGLFVFHIKLKQADKNIIIFQGLRNLKHLDVVAKDFSVAIIGSKPERAFAHSNNLLFIWSFPLESALNIAAEFNFHYFANVQIERWASLTNSKRKVVILSYEDTQPVGAFFAEILRYKSRDGICTRCICIQHGYFPWISNNIPHDGSFTDYNLVWDKAQIPVIKCNPNHTYEIGPPTLRGCKVSKISRVIFVGTGTNGDGTSEYKDAISFYSEVAARLKNNIDLRIIYRPHPNETRDQIAYAHIAKIFPEIDSSDKATLLQGDRSVFLGVASSLLYEAAYCNHFVASVNLNPFSTLTFKTDAEFEIDQYEMAASWIRKTLLDTERSSIVTRRPEYGFGEALDLIITKSQEK